MQIENKTPWDTEGLTALITTMPCKRVEKLTFITHQPMPGVKREKQRLYSCCESWRTDGELEIGLPSPKRVKSRMNALDLLAFTKDLEPHQVPLPVAVIESIIHSLRYAYSSGDRRTRRPHLEAECECDKTLPETPIIAGDTKAKTRPPVTVQQLERKLGYACAEVEGYEEALAEALTKRNKLLVRIENKRKRDAKKRAKLDRIAAKQKKLDDPTLRAVVGERTTP